MDHSEIARRRLQNQGISKFIFKDASDIVTRLGAVQSQDYAGAKWALGLRLKDSADPTLDQAFADGSILRTHLLRPTWHFVSPTDIRWMLELTAPRVHAVNAFMYRQTELDKAILKKSYMVLEKSLRGNKHLTRTELGSALRKVGIAAEGQRLAYIVMSAELDGLVCSGPRKGKQFTYALLEERVPQVRAWTREESLAELVRRYFSTRGPATLQDFTWWSGLTMADARNGIGMVKSQFVSEVIKGQTYWFVGSKPPAKEKSPTAYLLPNYDEYFIGFKDRSALGERLRAANVEANNSAFPAHVITVDGQLVGGWKRTLEKNKVILELAIVVQLTKAEKQAVIKAVEQYGKFIGLPVEVIWKN